MPQLYRGNSIRRSSAQHGERSRSAQRNVVRSSSNGSARQRGPSSRPRGSSDQTDRTSAPRMQTDPSRHVSRQSQNVNRRYHEGFDDDDDSDASEESHHSDGPSANNQVSSRRAEPLPPLEVPSEYAALLRALDACEGPRGGAVDFERLDAYLVEHYPDDILRYLSTREYIERAVDANMPIQVGYAASRQDLTWVRIRLTHWLFSRSLVGSRPVDVGVDERTNSVHTFVDRVNLTLETIQDILAVSPGHDVKFDASSVPLHSLYHHPDFLQRMVKHLNKKHFHIRWSDQDRSICVLGTSDEHKRNEFQDTIRAFVLAKGRMAGEDVFRAYINEHNPGLYLIAHTMDCAEIVRQASDEFGIPVAWVNEDRQILWTGSAQQARAQA